MIDDRQLLERYREAIRTADVESLSALVHPDIVVTYPQSGEVIRGRHNYIAMLEAYPRGLPEMDELAVHSEERSVQVVRPLPFGPPTITLTGEANIVFIEGVVDYGGDVGIHHVVSMARIRDGMVIEETSYFAEPFAAPDWRRPFTED